METLASLTLGVAVLQAVCAQVHVCVSVCVCVCVCVGGSRGAPGSSQPSCHTPLAQAVFRGPARRQQMRALMSEPGSGTVAPRSRSYLIEPFP